jgi:hypothetical protein
MNELSKGNLAVRSFTTVNIFWHLKFQFAIRDLQQPWLNFLLERVPSRKRNYFKNRQFIRSELGVHIFDE